MKAPTGIILIVTLAVVAFFVGREIEKGNREMEYKVSFMLQREIYHDLQREAEHGEARTLKEKIEFLSNEWKEARWHTPDEYYRDWTSLRDRFYETFEKKSEQDGVSN